MALKCTVEACRSEAWESGLCQKHYSQQRRHGRFFDRTIHDGNDFVIEGDICRIGLYNRESVRVGTAIIDAEDAPKCRPFKWRLRKNGYVTSGADNLAIHHVILGVSFTKLHEVDHRDGNKLDNRKNNLRIGNRSQNSANKKLYCTNTSGFKGVTYCKQNCKWRAQITVNYKNKNLGYFTDILDAARAYNTAAKSAFGEFARLNEVPE
jgi:hypothetical protein